MSATNGTGPQLPTMRHVDGRQSVRLRVRLPCQPLPSRGRFTFNCVVTAAGWLAGCDLSGTVGRHRASKKITIKFEG